MLPTVQPRILMAGLLIALVTRLTVADDRLVRLTDLKAWLQTHGLAETETRIALLGLNPSKADVERQVLGRYEVFSKGAEGAPDVEADTNLLLFLARALPKSKFLLSHVSTAQGRAGPTTAESLAWAAARNADVAYLPHAAIPEGDDDRALFSNAVAACWRAGCLPITISPSATDEIPPGVLAVCLGGEPEMELGRLGDAVPDSYGRLRLNGQLLDALDTEMGLAAINSAAAYILTMLGSQPRATVYPHLERTASLLYSADLYVGRSKAEEKKRIAIPFVSVSRTLQANKDRTIRFFDLVSPYDLRIKSIEGFHNDPAKVSSDPRQQMLLAVDPDTTLRLVGAGIYLVDADPVYLVPSKPAIITVRIREDSHGQYDASYLLLRTLLEVEGQRARPFFTSVERDFQLDSPEPR